MGGVTKNTHVELLIQICVLMTNKELVKETVFHASVSAALQIYLFKKVFFLSAPYKDLAKAQNFFILIVLAYPSRIFLTIVLGVKVKSSLFFMLASLLKLIFLIYQ